MKNRRNFMKSSLAITVGVLAATIVPAFAKKNSEKNIFAYSKKNPGRWEGKDKSHAPVVTIKGNKVTVKTKHGMSKAHYIVKHTLVTDTGEVLGEHVFSPTDKKAVSSYKLTKMPNKLFALSYCNLHDQWVTEVILYA